MPIMVSAREKTNRNLYQSKKRSQEINNQTKKNKKKTYRN